MRKKLIITLLFGSVLSVSAQLSKEDQCEIIAQEAGCAAIENGITDWEGHYGIMDAVYALCMSQ